MPDLTTYIIISIVFFCGAFLQSVVGFGFNVIGVPAVTILTNARTAVTVVSLPSFLNCLLLVWRIGRSESKVALEFNRVLPLLITSGIGTLVGATLLAALDPSIILICLGILLLIFIATDKVRKNWRPHPRHATRLAVAVGLATGILNGLAGVSGPTLAPYLYTLRLDKHQFVYYLNLLFLFLGTFQFISFGLLGFFTWERILTGLSLIPVSLAGLYLGMWARSRVSQVFFNRLVLLVLFVTALDLLRRGLHITF
ncbi:MAG TPA: sulfite exporter TauE/SafE family protein [Chloroflexia bacterium]|nr:sulfite exporter TauE/SafE family protein [Chloroflexia bacterium]